MAREISLFTVILHYGDPRLTRRLARELESGGEAVHVLDNAAPVPYDTRDRAFWLRLPENRYWAGALELALEQAREQGATHLWFCNNDVRCLSDPPYGPRVKARMQRMAKRLGAVPGVYAPSVDRNPYHPQMIRRPGVAFSRVACVDGIAPVLSLECVAALGGLDAADNPYGYGVDVWLSLRAHRAGWPVIVDHGVVLRHEYHTTARSTPGFMDRAARAEDAYCASRLGADWREQLLALQHDCIDEAHL